MQILYRSTAALALLLLLTGCSDSDFGIFGSDVVQDTSNQPPLVTISGPAGEVASGVDVTLSTVVIDDYSTMFTYSWVQTAGESVSFTDTASDLVITTPATKFNSALSFEVTVTDGHGASTVTGAEVNVTGDIYASIAAATDLAVLEDFETVHADGFLTSLTPGAGVYSWERGSGTPARNITAPIAHFLARAGYLNAADIGFEEMHARTSADPVNWSNFNSADLGVFFYAFEVTGEQKYLDVATAMWPQAQLKYGPNGANSPRTLAAHPGIWGYDAYNMLMGAWYADQYGLNGADSYYADFVTWYEMELPGQLMSDPVIAIFSNLTYEQFGIGARDDSTVFSVSDFVAGSELQNTAYALMSGTIDKEEAVDYLLANFDSGTISESVAEAIAALHLFIDD